MPDTRKPVVFLTVVAVMLSVLQLASLAAEPPTPEAPSEAAKSASDSMLGEKAGEVRHDNWLKMKLVWCPPGSVRMEEFQFSTDGIASEPTATSNVFLTRGYWLGKYEVTQAEWKRVKGTEPWRGSAETKEGDDFPATNVNWNDATDFCRRLTATERNAERLPDDWEYTLPTEAQWVRACRARTDTRFSFGDDESHLGEYAWYSANASGVGEQFAHRGGQKKPNPWGIYDMYGNTWEWCRDYHSTTLLQQRGRDAEATAVSMYGTIRGGSWNDVAAHCGHTSQGVFQRENGSSLIGFRVTLSLVQSAK